MKITTIVTVSPINPAHGMHEVHARTQENVDIAFSISRDALGCLTAHFEATIPPDAAYAKWHKKHLEEQAKAESKKGS